MVGLSVFATSVVLQPPWGRAELAGELLLLNLFSLALTSFGFVWSIFKDLKWLHREELDIDFVLRLGLPRKLQGPPHEKFVAHSMIRSDGL